MLKENNLTKTYSLTYFGNQFQSNKFIQGLKSGSLAFVRLGDAAGRFGNVLTVVSLANTGVRYLSDDISYNEMVYSIVSTTVVLSAAVLGGAQVGVVAGTAFIVGEYGYGLLNDVNRYGQSVRRLSNGSGFIYNFRRHFGVIPSISGFE